MVKGVTKAWLILTWAVRARVAIVELLEAFPGLSIT